MRLTENTLNVLKNFSTINQGMVFKRGNVLRTISKQQNVMAKATVEENFESDFAIYDLNRLLALLASLKDADIDVNDKTMKIVSGTSSTVYGLSDESMIVAPPQKDLQIKDAEVKFNLSRDDLNQVLKLSGILGLPNIAVRGDRTKITLATLDVKNSDSDEFSIEVGKTDAEFKMIFVTENIKLIPGNYSVEISSKGFSHFKHEKDAIEYWIATEVGSRYEA